MGYIFRAFIRKNNKDLLEKLKERGQTICTCCYFDDSVWLENCLENKTYSIHGIGYNVGIGDNWTTEQNLEFFLQENSNNNPKYKSYDCGENEELFLNLTSLRDDTDDFQLHRLQGTDQCLVKVDGFELGENWVKCTAEEIIELFNNRENE